MKNKKITVGIAGCGAIGSGIAESIVKNLKDFCCLNGLFDINIGKAAELQKKLKKRNLVKKTMTSLIKSSDLIVEAVSHDSIQIVDEAVKHKKDVLVMSVGQLLRAQHLLKTAEKNQSKILIPSGAIAGIDAIKAASLLGIKKITLTTRKPVKGFKNNPYLEKKNIDLSKIKGEYCVFKGSVNQAVKYFPKNINVAATLAIASQSFRKLVIRIIASPKFKNNSHEIMLEGPFGRITTKTENTISPKNPKTSTLAILSGIQTLKQYCLNVRVGT